MNRFFATLFFTVLFGMTVCAQSSQGAPPLKISEIMYNNPGTDDYEFVELTNSGTTPIDLTGYVMYEGTFDTFYLPSVTLPAGGFIVIAKDSAFLVDSLGATNVYDWDEGLNNTGDFIVVKTSVFGSQTDSLTYSNVSPWPNANGTGSSLIRCDFNSISSDPLSWQASMTSTGFFAGGSTEFLCSPGSSNSCTTPPPPGNFTYQMIDAINDVDVDGVAVSDGDSVELRGVVHCQDFDGNNGYTFALVEYNNDGITVFNFNDVNGYAVTEGDSLHAFGVVDQFNGLLQLAVDSIELISQGNTLVTPMAVTMLDETTENKVITLDSVTLADPTQWGNAGGSFNVDVVTLNNDTLLVRVDGDLALADSLAPSAYFNVHGIGSQFDNSSPYTGGYQLLACDYTVLGGGTVTPPVVTYNYYPIDEINNVDANGEYDSLGVNVEIRGVVHCGNFATAPTASLQLLEYTNDGINAFVGSATGINYTVTEGDSLHLFGSIGSFSGILELVVDSLSVISSGNATLTPMLVTTAIDESMEHKLIELNNVSLVTPADWTGAGTGFNVDVTDGSNTWQVRIDNDVDLYAQSAPVGTFNIYGFGSQFDPSSPYDSGYQLKACNSSITIVNGIETAANQEVRIFPNPTSTVLNIQAAQIDAVVITNTLGQQLINLQNVNDNNLQINTVDLAKGVYNITIVNNGQLQTKQFLKQ